MKKICFVIATSAFIALILLIVNHSVLLLPGSWSKQIGFFSDLGSIAAGLSNIAIAFIAYKAIPSFIKDRTLQSKYELKIKIKKSSHVLTQHLKAGYNVFTKVKFYLVSADDPFFEKSFFVSNYNDDLKKDHINLCTALSKDIELFERNLVSYLTDYEIEFDEDFWELKQHIHAYCGLVSKQLSGLSELIQVSIEPRDIYKDCKTSFESFKKASQITLNYDFLYNEKYFNQGIKEDPLLTLICDLEETCNRAANNLV